MLLDLDDAVSKAAEMFAGKVGGEVVVMPAAACVECAIGDVSFRFSSGLVSVVLSGKRISTEALRWYMKRIEEAEAEIDREVRRQTV